MFVIAGAAFVTIGMVFVIGGGATFVITGVVFVITGTTLVIIGWAFVMGGGTVLLTTSVADVLEPNVTLGIARIGSVGIALDFANSSAGGFWAWIETSASSHKLPDIINNVILFMILIKD